MGLEESHSALALPQQVLALEMVVSVTLISSDKLNSCGDVSVKGCWCSEWLWQCGVMLHL